MKGAIFNTCTFPGLLFFTLTVQHDVSSVFIYLTWNVSPHFGYWELVSLCHWNQTDRSQTKSAQSWVSDKDLWIVYDGALLKGRGIDQTQMSHTGPQKIFQKWMLKKSVCKNVWKIKIDIEMSAKNDKSDWTLLTKLEVLRSRTSEKQPYSLQNGKWNNNHTL